VSDSAIFDIAVIGGGPGGYVAALRAAQLGARVALVERARIGGVCLNSGCIPTKALAATAEWLAAGRTRQALGVVGDLRVDPKAAFAHKDAAVAQIVGGVEQLLLEQGVVVLRGHATLLNPSGVAVEDAQGARQIGLHRGVILSPGSRPVAARFPGADLPQVLESDALLLSAAIPRRLVIIGGGVVGVEFASIWAALGTHVTVVEALPTLLPAFDADLGRRLQLAFRRAGIAAHTRTRVEGISSQQSGLRVAAIGPQGAFTLEAEAVLLAMGRRPAIAGMGLEEAGVRLREGAIGVNERLETSLPGVYAVGDAVGGAMLAHRAMAQGRIAAENIMGADHRLDEKAIPSCVFASPEVATVGLTMAQAQAVGIAAEEIGFPFASNGRALAAEEAFGEAKLVCTPGGQQVLGMHIIGPHATDLISEGVLAVRLGLSADDIADSVHPHPTYGEAVMEAALGFRGAMIHHLYKPVRHAALRHDS